MQNKIWTLKYLPTLNGLRAIAIFAVLISHSSQQLFGQFGIFENQFLIALTSHGRLGVDLFFAISGFLITYRLLAEFQENGKIAIGAFYIRRIFRILPPYFIYLLIIVLLAWVGTLKVDAWEISSSILFIRNYFMVWTVGGDSSNHFWSLAVEEHFYLLWPITLVLLRPKRALWLVPLLALFVYGWMSYDAKYHLFAKFLPDAGSLFRSDTRMDSLLWGCFSAFIYPSIQSCFDRNRYLGNVCQVVVSLFLISVIVFSLPMIHFWTAFLFPLVVIFTVTQSKNVFGRILDHPMLSWFGRMSYSLYIWQTLFLQCQGTSFSLSHNVGGVIKLFYWMLDLTSILLIALLSYYFVEQKMIKFGRNFTQKLSQTK